MFKMSKAVIFGSLILAIVAVSGCENKDKVEAKSAQDAVASKACNTKELNALGLKLLWQRVLPMPASDRIFKLQALGDNIYYSTENRALYSVAAATGNPKWSAKVTDIVEKVFDPILVEDVKLSEEAMPPSKSKSKKHNVKLESYDLVVVNTPSKLLAINAKNGKIVRKIPLAFRATSGAACHGQVAELAGIKKTINEVNLLFGASGKSKYTGMEVKVPLRSAESDYFMADLSGKVASYSANVSFTRNWTFSVQGPVTTPFITNYRGLFVASGDRRIYALDLTTGHRLWNPVRIGGKFVGPMVADSDRLYQFASGKGLVAINMDKGTTDWILPTGLLVLGSFDEKVFVLSATKQLIAINAEDGTIIGSASLKNFDRFAINTTRRAIYAATGKGKIIAIAPKDVEDVTLEMLRK